MSNEELLDIARNDKSIDEIEMIVLKRIKEKCATCTDCTGCRFSYNDGTFEDCALDYYPSKWRLKEADEWRKDG